MLGAKILTPFDNLFNMQREFDRLFNRFWNELPAASPALPATGGVQIQTSDDGWRVDIPMPGIDPEHVTVEAAGNSISVRAEEPGEGGERQSLRYEQTLAVPAFLDVDKLHASHRHGMLRLTVPLKESVKPRRIQIDTTTGQKQLANDQKQLATTAA